MADRLLTAREVAERLGARPRPCSLDPAGRAARIQAADRRDRSARPRSTRGWSNGRRPREDSSPATHAAAHQAIASRDQAQPRGGLDAREQQGHSYSCRAAAGDCAGTTSKAPVTPRRSRRSRRRSPLPRRDRAAATRRGPGAARLTLAEFVPLYMERHAAGVRPRTIEALASGWAYATRRSATCRCATWSA